MSAFTLQSFTQGKSLERNEDAFGYNDTSIVLSDGATDKTGARYEQDTKTGGEVASRLVVEEALSTNLNGQELVDAVTERFRQYYQQYAPEAVVDPTRRFAATMVVARIVGLELVVTQVGDSSFRINGVDEFTNDKQIDKINSGLRAGYIKRTGDVPGGRKHILPRLQKQYKLQNNPDDELGYGAIDGSSVPAKFVKTFSFPLTDVRTLEVVTDGYFGAFPREVSIEAYEKLYEHIQQVDPHKIGEFASTKPDDDRTVLIAKF